MVKATVFYSGSRNFSLELKIQALAESCSGTKGGEWGFSENGFQALFLFKKDSIAQDFITKSRQKIDSRIIINIGK